MQFSIGNDHAGVEYKEAIVSYLRSKGHELLITVQILRKVWIILTLFIQLLKDVSSKKASLGIIICGSGNGASMTANKYQDIRSALCWT